MTDPETKQEPQARAAKRPPPGDYSRNFADRLRRIRQVKGFQPEFAVIGYEKTTYGRP